MSALFAPSARIATVSTKGRRCRGPRDAASIRRLVLVLATGRTARCTLRSPRCAPSWCASPPRFPTVASLWVWPLSPLLLCTLLADCATAPRESAPSATAHHLRRPTVASPPRHGNRLARLLFSRALIGTPDLLP
eukprot:1187284-Prorocentrum_minimum.AAC.2